MKNVHCNERNRFLPVIAVPMRRILARGSSVARLKSFFRTVCKNYCVRPVEKIDHRGAVFVTMDAYVTTRFYGKYPQPQLPTRHAVNLGPQVNDLGLRRLESYVSLWCSLLCKGDQWSPTQDQGQ